MRIKPAPGRMARGWQPPAPASELETRKRAVLDAIRAGEAREELLGCTEIARATNYSMDEVYRTLDKLLLGRRIEKVNTTIATRYGSRVRYRINRAKGEV